MGRLLKLLILVALPVVAAVWLADRPGEVTIRWQGWRLDTSLAVLVMLLLAVLAVVHGLGTAIRAVLRSPGRFLAARKSRRLKEGYRALSDGLTAVAAGDSRRAHRLARRADKLLPDRSLTGFLGAQAAEMAGDPTTAEKHLAEMVERPESAFLGLKGLLALALKRGDQAQALDFARRAWALQPGAEGLATILFDLQARAGQWAEAELTLAEVKRKGSMGGADLLHRRALVLDQRAAAAEAAGDTRGALTLALDAHRADPVFVPAAVRAARLLHRLGKERRAAAVIEHAWRAAPHPALVEAWIALAPAETALMRVKRMERLVRANPDSFDGHLGLAEAALSARLWGQARTHLSIATEATPSARAYSLLARLEREERDDDAAAAAWTAKAAAAPAASSWRCTACGRQAETWQAVCAGCGAVDGLEWR